MKCSNTKHRTLHHCAAITIAFALVPKHLCFWTFPRFTIPTGARTRPLRVGLRHFLASVHFGSAYGHRTNPSALFNSRTPQTHPFAVSCNLINAFHSLFCVVFRFVSRLLCFYTKLLKNKHFSRFPSLYFICWLFVLLLLRFSRLRWVIFWYFKSNSLVDFQFLLFPMF